MSSKQFNRSARARIAADTLEIIKNGRYINGNGDLINIKDDLESAINHSKIYRPEEEINIKIGAAKAGIIRITNETTLEAAKNPGGGFLSGSQAQEESLVRSSGLYSCLSKFMEMYECNRRLRTGLYSDYMIYSPDVPVFRDDSGNLLDRPYNTSFITMPSVNAGTVRKNEQQNVDKIEKVMLGRIYRILKVAAINGHNAIILGAYGCGVFKNDPLDVAKYFQKLLIGEGLKNLFDTVIFAIPDTNMESIFKKVLL